MKYLEFSNGFVHALDGNEAFFGINEHGRVDIGSDQKIKKKYLMIHGLGDSWSIKRYSDSPGVSVNKHAIDKGGEVWIRPWQKIEVLVPEGGQKPAGAGGQPRVKRYVMSFMDSDAKDDFLDMFGGEDKR